MAVSADKLSVEEAAGDSYAMTAQAISVERFWCDRCLTSSIQRIRRVLITVDTEGVTTDELGRGWYCHGHEDWLR